MTPVSLAPAGHNPASMADAPYFDPHALRHELTDIFHNATDVAEVARRGVLQRLKRLVATARSAAKAGLEKDGSGRRCAQGLARFQDELIHLVHDYTIAHVYRPPSPTASDRMAVIATGGYGRGMLAPGSDIDLLFLLPSKQTAWGESVVEYMLYLLWDLGFKVGHATRTTEQCLKLSGSDMTIRTAMLDSRLIFGDTQLFDTMTTRFRREVVDGAASARAFIEAKMTERDERHTRTGESRYKVEPNIKDGKGGLRDLHTLHWVARYLHGETPRADMIRAGIYTPAEAAEFRRCEDFLWTVRCHLHFLTGRPEERLSFDVQTPMAQRLGYRDRRGLRAVERFMKHYFLVAKNVGDLTTILASSLEMQQLKASPNLQQLFSPSGWRQRRQLRRRTEFRIDNGRLNVSDREVFNRDPVNLIRYFAYAEELNVFFHPDALRLIRSSLRLIDDKLRADPEANRIFLGMLTSAANAESTLRRMNEAGVLGGFVPEFGKVVSMMQFNMYHHFTVDEHLVRTVGALSAVEQGAVSDSLPLSTTIIKTVQNRRALYVAAFLHDVAKGRDEDHSIAGARDARRLCPRFGLTPAETETVAWLIEQHLTMSTVAQSRDLGDPKTIRAFADIVQSPERLKLLLLLTVADIRAVGPGIWNGWKGQLLRTLYYETEPLVAGGYTQIGSKQRVAAAQEAFRIAMKDMAPSIVDRFIERQYPDYWLKTEIRKQADHARLVADAEARGQTLATSFTSNAFTASTELAVFAPNHPRVLALFAGACAAAGANIVGAHISSTRDGFALDTFLLQREFEQDDDEARRAKKIGEQIAKLLRGEVRLSALMSAKREIKTHGDTFVVAPDVIVDNALSDQFTVLEVSGLDRRGLLYELTSAISDLNLDITSAHITTFGEKAVDVFYVTDLTGRKITSPPREKAIKDRLIAVFAAGATAGAKPAP
jgi:[protein-PII] uridylyltransferase